MLQNNAKANVAAKLYATKTWPNDSDMVRGQKLAEARQSPTPMSMTVCAFYAHSNFTVFAAK